MKVLIACEYSGIVREAFKERGHDAWSCDLLPTDIEGQHLQGDVFNFIDKYAANTWKWDLMIAHPPCTYLCNSGVSWLHRKEGRWDKMREGAEFFKKLLDAPIPKICIENPIMHKYAKEIIGCSQSQSIQPYEFAESLGSADNVSKRTCLWLKNLPLLKPTGILTKHTARQDIHTLPPSKDRWKIRSKTFQGIANAMAEQWG